MLNVKFTCYMKALDLLHAYIITPILLIMTKIAIHIYVKIYLYFHCINILIKRINTYMLAYDFCTFHIICISTEHHVFFVSLS